MALVIARAESAEQREQELREALEETATRFAQIHRDRRERDKVLITAEQGLNACRRVLDSVTTEERA